jgi:hypothetical protein
MGKGAPKHKSFGGKKGGSSSNLSISKKSKRGANRGGGGKGANFAEVSVRQKNSSLMKRGRAAKLMKVKAMGRMVHRSEENLRSYVENPKPKVIKGYDPKMRGMELTGPARPAIDVELSDHGCGLRLFECRQRCVRDEDREIEIDLYEKYENGKFANHEATKEHLLLLQKAGDACREGGHALSAIEHYENGLKLDETDLYSFRPRLVAVMMDTGDAARARQLIPEESTNCTYPWTLFLIEYISHYLLKEKDSSPHVVMRALERALACNPHVALFLSLPNLFEEVVDANSLLRDIDCHHHLYQPDNGSGSSGSSGSSESSESSSSSKSSNNNNNNSNNNNKVVVVTEVSAALAYAIDQFGCWRDAGNDEGDDVRTFVYENVVRDYYEPVNNLKSHELVSSIRLVRATYAEFVLSLNELRKASSKNEELDFRSSGDESDADMDDFETFAK